MLAIAMAEDQGFFSDYKGNKLMHSLLCFNATIATSSGIWLGEYPLDYSFPVLLLQLTVIFITARVAHAVLRPIGLPQPISHVIGGMLLGRSGLCRFRKFQEVVFPKRSWIHLDNISMLAFVLFTFVVAVKTDLSMVRKSGKKAIAIAQISTVLPFLLVFFVATFVSTVRTDVHAVQYTLNFAARWALTSNIVICFLLAEFKLLTSKLGRLAMSASLIADFQCVIISSTFLFLNTCIYQSIFVGMTFFFSFIGFVAGIWLFARPIVIWIIRRTPEGSAMDEGFFLCILLMAIGSSFAAELLGQSVTLGPLLLGVVIPGGPPLGTAVVDRLERLVSAIFLPVFLIIAGLRSNVDDVLAGKLWMPIAYLILLSVVAKLFGVFVPCLYCRMSLRDTFVLSLILNSRGIIEINTFNNLEDFNVSLFL